MVEGEVMTTKQWEIGQEVCDMHYGLPEHSGYPERIPLETRKLVKIEVAGSTEILQLLLRKLGCGPGYTNKFAVVVGYDGQWYKAAYTYDDNYFGMFEFRVCGK
jgi:hypothetical protein